MNNHILFVHIPKTAGTSFRLAAQHYFGKENTYYDYSPAAIETSQEILKYVYEEQDLYGLSTCFAQGEKVFLSGHFPTSKYAPIFESLNIITFVRDPIQQVLSHYKHHKTHLGYQEDLETFIKDKRFKNLQSRLLSGRPLETYGFIGLTEEYNKSIELINDYYGFDIAVMSENISAHDEALTMERLDPYILKLIKDENEEDLRLYKRVKKIFTERLKCYQDGVPNVHIILQERSHNSIAGYAITRKNDLPVEVEVYRGKECLATLYAKEYKPNLLRLNLPRKGFFGFSFTSKDIIKNEKVLLSAHGKIFKVKSYLI